MLVALLRANPNAFIGGNVTGSRPARCSSCPAPRRPSPFRRPRPEHRTAQSQDFGEYRRRLADNAPTSKVADADRQTSGKLQANVEDRNAANASSDKLKISQGLAPGRPTEEQIALAKQAQASNARVAECPRTFRAEQETELNKIQAASGAAPRGAALRPGGAGRARRAPLPSQAPAAAAPAPAAPRRPYPPPPRHPRPRWRRRWLAAARLPTPRPSQPLRLPRRRPPPHPR